MKKLAGTAALLLAAGCLVIEHSGPDLSWIEYPAARRGDDADVHHGVKVADPYRWLEDEGSEESRAWLQAQDAITGRFFDELPQRREVMDYLRENWLDGALMVPVRAGSRTFWFETDGDLPHPVLRVRDGGGEPRTLFNLNERDPEGVLSTRTEVTVSPDGRYVGYPIHRSGADAAEWRFMDVQEGLDLEDALPESYAFVSDWLPDESGFLYTWVDLPTLMGQPSDKAPGIYLHRMGEPVAGDALVYGRAWEGQYMAVGMLADDENSLLIYDMSLMGGRGGWGVRPLAGGAATPVTWLIEPTAEHHYAWVGSSGSEVYLVTDYGAPNWRLVAADIRKPGRDHLREVVPERDEPISMIGGGNSGHVALHQDRLYVTYIQHTSHIVRSFDLQGAPGPDIELPFMGSVSAIGTREDDPVLYLGLQAFLVPQAIYAYDTGARSLTPLTAPLAPAAFADYQVERVFYESHDGVRVPMTIISRKGAPRDGSVRTLLYGYGGWGIPLLPRFSNWIHTWLSRGGSYALANLRGGGEYGEAWHEAGMFLHKQDVFEDFYAAAGYLAAEGYASPSRLTILGGSNGGLLTAAAYNQRPGLFGAVVSQVAAVDMLRLQDTPIGATVTMELGRPDQSREMFDYLKSYSPLHNVRHQGPYPPILSMVGENDPRCKPGHIYKYVAELQREPASERLALLRVIRGAGHGSQRRDEQISWIADEVAFAWAMTE